MLTRRTSLKRTGFARSKAGASAGARNVRLAPRRAEPRRSSREHDPQYLARVRALPCAARFIDGHRCQGVIHAHHAGARGLGQKAHDHTAIPLCMVAHSNWHDANGCFAGWPKDMRAEWAAMAIEATQHAMKESTP